VTYHDPFLRVSVTVTPPAASGPSLSFISTTAVESVRVVMVSMRSIAARLFAVPSSPRRA
jgi:hypothetical protein